jgi:glycosyltransferase involved in cell wall biosynthesis
VLNVSGVQGELFENYVCYLHSPSDLEIKLTKLGVPVYALGVTGKLQWLKGIVLLRKLIRSLEIDLIHTNLYDSDIIGGIVGRLTKRPVISTIANVCFEQTFKVDNPKVNWLKLETSRIVRAAIAHTCNYHLISVSESVAESARRRLMIPDEKTSVIYRALPQNRLDPPQPERTERLQAELGLSQFSPVLLNLGRLVPQKGQVYLIEAMGIVVQHFPQARLLMVGDGGLKSDLEKLSNHLGLEKHVTFSGQRDDVRELLEVADIFVFPSLFEGCPNALLEAMAAGKPCIGSRIRPIEEVMEDGVTGILVPALSPQKMAEAIIKLASSSREEAAQMGERAKAWARQQFTVRVAVEKLGELYQKTLEGYYGPYREPSHVPAGR